jgi:transposase
MTARKPYPSDVSDEEWAFVVPYLALVREDAPQRTHDLRDVFNGLRWVVRTGSPWRYMPHDLPPWEAVYQQTRRWLKAGVFEAMVHDLRALLRLTEGRAPKPTAAIFDSRTLRSTPESGARGGYDGAKRKKGSKVHAAVDTLGHLLALLVTPADEPDREQVGELAEAMQEATGESVELAYVDQGYSGQRADGEAQAHGIRLEVVKHPEARRGFVLLPRRWLPQLRCSRSNFMASGQRTTPPIKSQLLAQIMIFPSLALLASIPLEPNATELTEPSCPIR